jgi:hypothetical protein
VRRRRAETESAVWPSVALSFWFDTLRQSCVARSRNLRITRARVGTAVAGIAGGGNTLMITRLGLGLALGAAAVTTATAKPERRPREPVGYKALPNSLGEI